jgi:hypothetical protein
MAERGVCAVVKLPGLQLRAYPRTVGVWLILWSPRSKKCLTPFPDGSGIGA